MAVRACERPDRRPLVDALSLRLEHPADSDPRRYDAEVDRLVAQIVSRVGSEMQRQPASMVYELISAQVERRLPGVPVDQDALRDAAARIAVGLPTR
jgi:hypothetical protein